MRLQEAGFNLVELIVSMALFTVLLTLASPSITDWASGLRVEMAAGEIAGVLRLARIYSTRYNVRVAVRFEVGDSGAVQHALFRDGDGDGVRTADIASGIDPEVRPPRRLAHLGRKIRFGIPPALKPRDPGDPKRKLDRLSDPIRFNRSDLASFSPRGTATPGTVYLTDGRRHLAAVRVNNRSGKITILRWDTAAELWR